MNAIAAARRRAQVVIAWQHNHDWEPEVADVPTWRRALNEVGLNGPDDVATRGFPTLASPAQAVVILDRIAMRSRPFGLRIDHSSGNLALKATG